ncbi:MAG: acetyl-CoA hydrolase/transferase family protein [Blastocatellia bacterium]|nr:acetyl-CoA hydrolase/transferase family protein [Chloracidobacterium sp.]MBL8185152.1 acetyl-CoA hydrolase/transferase family protein [Blastocatellia bacterium]HRJ87533.1 acetyl-CoA hydrolase/transferase C-terminal domain-containing protein [Pyrinomonadaceae bacterium]HRK50490.1 acetyl-CoA hydrolase/transferase C-terminal domain-containing protein [Pyrinomonadaceae bacterium]
MEIHNKAEDAVKPVKSNDRVFVHSVAAVPQILIDALVERAAELRDVEFVHLHTEGKATYAEPAYVESFKVNAFFVGPNIRSAVNDGRADYIPVFLSEIPALFRRGVLPIDVALIHVSTPDKHGFCSLGVSVDIARSAVECAKIVVAQINPQMPRTHGDALVHISDIDHAVFVDTPLPEVKMPELTDIDRAIGSYVAEMIEDGSTLQMGIGSIPNAVLASLLGHKDLGIHTEMFSDGLIELVEKGVVTGSKKAKHPGKIVAGFVMGTRRLYDFIDDNPQVLMLDIAYVNDSAVIRRNPRVIAVNSAIEVDLTGQICADSIGTRQYSGVGGQMDFIRGASLSEGGKPIIALPSITSRGESKIVPFLKEGAGVVTTRAHVHYVVTEYGVADLYGKNLRQRAAALIAVAHPDHREDLERSSSERFRRI